MKKKFFSSNKIRNIMPKKISFYWHFKMQNFASDFPRKKVSHMIFRFRENAKVPAYVDWCLNKKHEPIFFPESNQFYWFKSFKTASMIHAIFALQSTQDRRPINNHNFLFLQYFYGNIRIFGLRYILSKQFLFFDNIWCSFCS